MRRARVVVTSTSLEITRSTLLTGLLWAGGVGFIGALFPAVRAARLPLATALRAI